MKRFALLFLALPAALAAQHPNLPAIADTVFARWNSTHTPGCAVGVAREGKVLLTRGYGMADLETGTPITAQTIFESGSVAKQFPATAIMLLALDGKLTLDDPARKYLPELPEYDRPITIRHLLTHTSGLREGSWLVAAQGWPRGTRAHTQAELLDVVFRQKALNYPVGDYYSYTNSGYALAMTIVERVSGKSLQAFTQERIFGPLGMAHTRWRDDFTRLVPGRAQAYTREDDGWHLNMPFQSAGGPGAPRERGARAPQAGRRGGGLAPPPHAAHRRPGDPVCARAHGAELSRRSGDRSQRLHGGVFHLPRPLSRSRQSLHRGAVQLQQRGGGQLHPSARRPADP